MIIILLLFSLLFIISLDIFNNNNTNNIIRKRVLIESLQCIKYKNRNFMNGSILVPPLLASFPGSGNTWTRLLVEYSSSLYTGSIYNDNTIIHGYLKEPYCQKNMIAIKAHPNHLSIDKNGKIYINNSAFEKECLEGNITTFKRMAFIFRNPWESIWSEYHRLYSVYHHKGIDFHNNSITFNQFNKKDWKFRAVEQVKVMEKFLLNDWGNIKKENTVILRFEDLTNKSTRNKTLRKLYSFLTYNKMIDEEKLNCSFYLADDPTVHRSILPGSMTTDDAYKDKDIVCDIWNHLKPLKILYKQFGYDLKPWNDTRCD